MIRRPATVTTDGGASFEFACSLNGQEPQDGCSYEYQIVRVGNMDEVDWDSRDWLPTVSYTIFSGELFWRKESQQKSLGMRVRGKRETATDTAWYAHRFNNLSLDYI